jgi:uncharacterized protein (DUF58 family)
MTLALGDLLGRAESLEIVARRNVASVRTGAYRSAVVGRGLEFHEARRYVQGEPVRWIDWKMTARLDEPWVRRFVEEREREVIVAVDVSPSMHVGWQERTKLETAIELAATLAVSVVDGHDRLGLVCFAEQVHEVLRPELGKVQLYRVLRSLVRHLEAPPTACVVSDPRSAIHAIEAHRGRRFVVFLISDFLDHDVPEDLRYLRRRHDVSLLHVYDPLEYPKAGPVRLPARPNEGPAPHSWVRFDRGESVSAVQRHLAFEAGRLGIEWRSVSSAEPVAPVLVDLFLERQRNRRR